MKRLTTAAAELAEILRHASPDTAALNAGVAVELSNVASPAASLHTANALTEHDEQCALFAWAAANEAAHEELKLLFAIPNGGARHPAVAAQLKAEGVRAGVPDCFLAARRGTNGRIWGGLFVELKRSDKSNHATPAQKEWIERLRAAGYMALVAYGCEEAKQAIMAYLAQEG